MTRFQVQLVNRLIEGIRSNKIIMARLAALIPDSTDLLFTVSRDPSLFPPLVTEPSSHKTHDSSQRDATKGSGEGEPCTRVCHLHLTTSSPALGPPRRPRRAVHVKDPPNGERRQLTPRADTIGLGPRRAQTLYASACAQNSVLRNGPRQSTTTASSETDTMTTPHREPGTLALRVVKVKGAARPAAFRAIRPRAGVVARLPWPHFGRTTTLNAAAWCASLSSSSAGQR